MATRNIEVDLRQIDGVSFAAKALSGHWVIMDGSKEAGGHGAAASPIELFLMGAVGCASHDVVSILKGMRVELADYRVEASASRRDEEPKSFEKVELDFHLFGDVDEKKAERAVALSLDKYCSAMAMLRPGVEIVPRISIHPASEALGDGGEDQAKETK
jgi:putative redox protein